MLHVLRTVEAMTMPLHQPEKCHSSQNIIAITIMVVKISGIILHLWSDFSHLRIGEPNSLG